MKYRVRMDLTFDSEADAKKLMDLAKTLSAKATSINEGKDNEEIAYVDYHKCRHDEGLPCEKIERLEVREVIPLER